jgi:hypothetical protein
MLNHSCFGLSWADRLQRPRKKRLLPHVDEIARRQSSSSDKLHKKYGESNKRSKGEAQI